MLERRVISTLSRQATGVSHYGEMKIAPADIKELVKNFKDKVRCDISIYELSSRRRNAFNMVLETQRNLARYSVTDRRRLPP